MEWLKSKSVFRLFSLLERFLLVPKLDFLKQFYFIFEQNGKRVCNEGEVVPMHEQTAKLGPTFSRRIVIYLFWSENSTCFSRQMILWFRMCNTRGPSKSSRFSLCHRSNELSASFSVVSEMTVINVLPWKSMVQSAAATSTPKNLYYKSLLFHFRPLTSVSFN